MENLNAIIERAKTIETANREATNAEDAGKQLFSYCLLKIAGFKSQKPSMKKVIDAAKIAAGAAEGTQINTLLSELITDRGAVSLCIRLLLNQILNFTIMNDQRHAVRAGTEAPQEWQVERNAAGEILRLKLPNRETDPDAEYSFIDSAADIIYQAAEDIKAALETVYIALFPNEPCLAWKQVAEVNELDGSVYYRDIEDKNQALLLTQQEAEEYRAKADKARAEAIKKAVLDIKI